ncbi:MAG: signal peptidase I [Pirellulaceae bacterium]|nr:signal peptidase I [Pirellulaceae bacterium]
MVSTIVFAALFLGVLFVTAALWAFFLWLGLRWADVSEFTLRGIMLTTGIVIVGQIALSVWMQFAFPPDYLESLVGALSLLTLAVMLQLGTIGSVFRASTRQVLQAWLLTLLASVTTFVIVILILRPALYETYTIPTNAMAPTLVGVHVESVCSECELTNYGSPLDDLMDTVEPPRMICEQFHIGPALSVRNPKQASDRILVAKFLKPQRWDIIVFHYPGNPGMLDAKRLVGLPGETIIIKDGAVWADNQKVIPPTHLAGLKYDDGIPELPQVQMWGSTNRPAVLGADEYFVLGDFSAQSADSRVWESGAATHNPFAVPESYVVGVVTHTYWPFKRLGVHR